LRMHLPSMLIFPLPQPLDLLVVTFFAAGF
jgi:hypothetical protein